MKDFSQATLRLMSDLLHDARVQEVMWDRNLGTFTICFECLRRNLDGSELSDRTVEFKLTGIQTVAIGYDSVRFETRPSQFHLPRRITADELADWPFRSQEAFLRINSASNAEVLECARVDWFIGDEPSLRVSACTFKLLFDQWRDFGLPMLHVCLLVGGEAFAVSSSGVPLDIDEWEKQYRAWWTGWKKYWDSKNAEVDEERGEYELAIPAGKSEAPDLNYRPPAEPVFDLEPTDAPPELVLALREYFESLHLRDWRRLAVVYPNPNLSYDERALQLEGWELTHGFGQWGYPRTIDEWWLEGSRACVVLRGIERNGI